MITITFSAIKGGVGKSSIAILLANILNKSGLKVLCIDADPQNSMSFYYLPDSRDITASLANILNNFSDIKENIVTTDIGIDLIPSSLDLINCRNVDTDILSKQLMKVKKIYDYCIIDTAPTFDNIVHNCILSADKIISPVQFSNFDYKSSLFYKNLMCELGLEFKWHILINKCKTFRTGTSITAQFFDIYNSSFSNILKNRIPDTSLIKHYFDTGANITKSKVKIYDALIDLTSEIVENKVEVGAF